MSILRVLSWQTWEWYYSDTDDFPSLLLGFLQCQAIRTRSIHFVESTGTGLARRALSDTRIISALRNDRTRLYLFILMTSSNENIFRVTGHLCWNSPASGEVPAQRPVTRNFDVFFDLRPNKRLSKQWWGWWFETPSSPLWRHCNVYHKGNLAHVGISGQEQTRSHRQARYQYHYQYIWLFMF